MEMCQVGTPVPGGTHASSSILTFLNVPQQRTLEPVFVKPCLANNIQAVQRFKLAVNNHLVCCSYAMAYMLFT